MLDDLAALLAPAVMAAIVIAFVVWLYRSQMAKKREQGNESADHGDVERDHPDD